MLHIETSNVYTAQEDALGIEKRGLLRVQSHRIGGFSIYSLVTGLQENDLAVFGDEVYANGRRKGQDWLVTDFHDGNATLVNSTPLLENPDKYLTPHLERLIRLVGPDEASELGINSLIRIIFKNK